MQKSLIIYSTVDGQTKAICKNIAQFASETSIDVLPISNNIVIEEANMGGFWMINISSNVKIKVKRIS